MKYLNESEGVQGLVVEYVYPKFSFELGKMNQWSFTFGYWNKTLELEFFRWFLYVYFDSRRWTMWKEVEQDTKSFQELLEQAKEHRANKDNQ